MLDDQGGLDCSTGFLDGSFVAAKRGGNAVEIAKIGKGSKVDDDYWLYISVR